MLVDKDLTLELILSKFSMYNINSYNHYIFIDEYSNDLDQKINKIKKVSIIFLNKSKDINNKELIKVWLWTKKKKFKFLVIDDVKLAFKFKADGIFITANNKKISSYKLYKNRFNLIGCVHNQLEYYFKKKQSCSTIALSPIFFNPKFSKEKALKPIKFNLISINWSETICALGGVNFSNIGKISHSNKIKSIAYHRAIKNPPTNLIVDGL